jgi:predicted permease
VAAQVALSFLLLFGAGLFVRSLQNLQGTKTGFQEIGNLITFQVSPALNGYQSERVVHFYDNLLQAIRSTPGVKAAGFASVPLLHGYEWDSSIKVEGYQARDGEDMQAFMNSLSPGYFAAMGVPLLEGRDFERRDIAKGVKVCIVNRKFAEHFFKGKSPIGRHLGQGSGPQTKLDVEIIGMVENTLYEGPREGVRRQVFSPHWGNNAVAFYVRTSQDSKSMYGALRAQVRNLDASMPVYEMKTLEAQLDHTLLTERLIAMLSAGFGALATLLASIGLYGVMAFVVARRTKEIGIRMALGAQPGSVLWLVMKEVLLLFSIGLAIGVPAAVGLGRYVSAQLYGVQSNDPWVAGFAIMLLTMVASLAGLIPARHASGIDPLLALRYE